MNDNKNQCCWKSKYKPDSCSRKALDDSGYCLFHKVNKNEDEGRLFWEAINFDNESVNSKDNPYADLIRHHFVECYKHGSQYGNFNGFVFPKHKGVFNYKFKTLNPRDTFHFIENTFENDCLFDNYDFGNNNVEFIDVTINGIVSFEKAIFRRRVVFKNTNLLTYRSAPGRWPFFDTVFNGQELKFIGGSIYDIFGIKLSENTDLIIENAKISDLRHADTDEGFIFPEAETYRIAKKQALRHGDFNASSKYLYKEKEVTRKELFDIFRIKFKKKNNITGNIARWELASKYLFEKDFYEVLFKFLGESIKKYIIGYGERPARALLASLFIIICYGVAYWSFRLHTPNESPDLWKSIFFSIVTFTTVGYGNIIPTPGLGEFLASTEMISGVTFIAIWTGTIIRKMTR